jgi:hypothetical protein
MVPSLRCEVTADSLFGTSLQSIDTARRCSRHTFCRSRRKQ